METVDFGTVLAGGGLAMLLLEGFKFLWRLFVNPEFQFPSKFYVVAIPVMNILVTPLLALLGLEGYSIPTDWLDFGRQAMLVLLSSLISVLGYEQTIGRAKNAFKERRVVTEILERHSYNH